MSSYQLDGSVGVPNDQFTSPSPPPLPFPPPPPPQPPANPGMRNTELYFTLTQEFVLTGTTDFSGAADRCRPLASSIHPEIGVAATALYDPPASCGSDFNVISCGFTAPRDIISRYNDWVGTRPLTTNPNACVGMRMLASGMAG
jgi:hypothetical protein